MFELKFFERRDRSAVAGTPSGIETSAGILTNRFVTNSANAQGRRRPARLPIKYSLYSFVPAPSVEKFTIQPS
ncbi:MAG: hypothetical protein ACKVS6_09540 [Planctomycetota bacterium]